MVHFARRAEGGTIALGFLPPALVLAIAAAGPGWSGGFAYGPRILIEAVPPLVVLVACGVDHVLVDSNRRTPAWLLLGISIALQVPHYIFPNDAWNRRYQANLDAAAWRAPELQITAHARYAAEEMGLR